MESTLYTINSQKSDMLIQVLIDKIKYGYELQELDEDEPLTDDKILKYNDSIILDPDYQREYRSSIKDESSLIESVLIGIPIPPIFLANDHYNDVQVMNVVDGQHRLRAFYRYINNKFKLKELNLAKDLEGKYFKDCDLKIKQKILSCGISSIVFRDFPGKDFELEIFNRYNKGTKPLTPQEIRHAVYNSEFNNYINRFAKSLLKSPVTNIAKAYNATKDRIQKKKLQESLFVILNILENGINVSLEKSLDYAEDFMQKKSNLEKEDGQKSKDNFDNIINLFEEFNDFIKLLCEKIEYPFSREIYGVSSRNYKFQISIAMILSGIFHKMINSSDFDMDKLLDPSFLSMFIDKIEYSLSNSFLENPDYNGSSTNSKEIVKLIDDFTF